MDKHFLTSKHIKTTQNNGYVAECSKKTYMCETCKIKYNDRAGLWRHKKKCPNNNYSTNTNNILIQHNHTSDKDELIHFLIEKENLLL